MIACNQYLYLLKLHQNGPQILLEAASSFYLSHNMCESIEIISTVAVRNYGGTPKPQTRKRNIIQVGPARPEP